VIIFIAILFIWCYSEEWIVDSKNEVVLRLNTLCGLVIKETKISINGDLQLKVDYDFAGEGMKTLALFVVTPAKKYRIIFFHSKERLIEIGNIFLKYLPQSKIY
jgi:hypothetical protein